MKVLPLLRDLSVSLSFPPPPTPQRAAGMEYGVVLGSVCVWAAYSLNVCAVPRLCLNVPGMWNYVSSSLKPGRDTL
jgi:hypothetical protein